MLLILVIPLIIFSHSQLRFQRCCLGNSALILVSLRPKSCIAWAVGGRNSWSSGVWSSMLLLNSWIYDSCDIVLSITLESRGPRSFLPLCNTVPTCCTFLHIPMPSWSMSRMSDPRRRQQQSMFVLNTPCDRMLPCSRRTLRIWGLAME